MELREANNSFNNRSLTFSNGVLEGDSLFARLYKWVDSTYRRESGREVLELITQLIREKGATDPQLAAQLGDRAIDHFKGYKMLSFELAYLDLETIPYRKTQEKNLVHFSETDKLEEKWERYGFKKEDFYDFPEFALFILSSPLGSQMKIFDHVEPLVGNEPAILVEGRYTKFSDLKARFGFRKSERYDELFIYEKATNQVYTYLGDGQGLTPHHPYLWDRFVPIARLTPEEHRLVREKANRFSRPPSSEPQTCIVQIVSNVNRSLPADWNICRNLINADHSFLRVVDEEGRVSSVGLIPQFLRDFPFRTSYGSVRQPDTQEYISTDERIVTNIPVSVSELKKLETYFSLISSYERNFGQRIAFNYVHQNCSGMVFHALKYATGIKLPIRMSLDEFFWAIFPDWFRWSFKTTKSGLLAIPNYISYITPEMVNNAITKITRVALFYLNFFAATLWTLLSIALGEGRGASGLKLENPENPEFLTSPLRNFKRWFDIREHVGYVPGAAHDWQKSLQSTDIFAKQTKLKITV